MSTTDPDPRQPSHGLRCPTLAAPPFRLAGGAATTRRLDASWLPSRTTDAATSAGHWMTVTSWEPHQSPQTGGRRSTRTARPGRARASRPGRCRRGRRTRGAHREPPSRGCAERSVRRGDVVNARPSCRDAQGAPAGPRDADPPPAPTTRAPVRVAADQGSCVAVSTSAPEGTRTPNLLIRSQMLYPLSYGRMAMRPTTRVQVAGAPPKPVPRDHPGPRCELSASGRRREPSPAVGWRSPAPGARG